MYSIQFLNKNQCGFIPQTSRTGAIKDLKEFVQEGFSKCEITPIVTLGVEGSFKSAWAPSVLKNYKKADANEMYTISQKSTSTKEEQPWQQTTPNWREQ